MRKGCHITSFETVDAGVADVEIRNESSNPVQVSPNAIVCRLSDNRIFDGYWLSRSGTKLIDRVAHMPGNSITRIRVFFFQNKNLSISDVYWK